MTHNSIWWWSSSSKDLGSLEYSSFAITPRAQSKSQIDLFKKLFVFIKAVYKKTLKKQLYKK